ncbi:MAG: hypothetical protein HY508_02340 [Acidobacteria bacterium]|nr:hypothetical protein [Acidobacteriota bacterium]
MHYLRTGGRIPIELPVEIRWKSPDGKLKAAQGKTVSISSNGVHTTVAAKLRPQTAITITVRLPLEFTKIPLQLFCQGRVIRRVPGTTGLRALIDDYKLRPVGRRAAKKTSRPR